MSPDLQVFKDKGERGNSSLVTLLTFHLGYNIIHIVPNAGLANEAFDFDELDKFLDVMDEIELWLMFDMSRSPLPHTPS